jgi:hypothetical protein
VSEAGCSQCAVLAESASDASFVELESHDDALFVLDSRGAISSTPKTGGDLAVFVAAGSGAVDFGVSATALAWVEPAGVSGTPKNKIQTLQRDGSAGPALDDFSGAALVTVGLGAAFVGAYAGELTGSEIIRYSLSDGTASSPTETLSDEEQAEVPIVAGGDAEVVWCRTHADHSSSSWRLGATGDPAKTDNAFGCDNLWSTGDGQIFVLDSSSGMNCYYRIDAAGQSTQLTCTSSDYEHLVPLTDGSVALIDSGSAVRRIGTDGQVGQLFRAEFLVGIQSDGDELYYATANHLGRFSLTSL